MADIYFMFFAPHNVISSTVTMDCVPVCAKMCTFCGVIVSSYESSKVGKLTKFDKSLIKDAHIEVREN